jgi:hypothetical protein
MHTVTERRSWFFDALCAMRAIRREVLQFRFKYPLWVVPEAGPKDSLHYYIYSDSLSWAVLRVDAEGIAGCYYPTTGIVYRPAFIAWYGLVNLGHYLRRRDPVGLKVFLNQVNWLERHALSRDDGSVVWPMSFDCQEGAIQLKAPWISGNAQGLVISALIRAWRLTRQASFLELLKKSIRVFQVDSGEGGIRCVVDGYVLYTEIPGYPPPGILDGFLAALLGLYDLFVETEDTLTEELFNQGIDGLKYMLHRWDYREKWTWYGSHDYLCPPSYHCLNRLLLGVLARLSGEHCLAEYAEHWDPTRLSLLGRAEIFLGFIATKNACRIRHRTWREKRVAA